MLVVPTLFPRQIVIEKSLGQAKRRLATSNNLLAHKLKQRCKALEVRACLCAAQEER
jgi:hypothetical protein